MSVWTAERRPAHEAFCCSNIIPKRLLIRGPTWLRVNTDNCPVKKK